MKCPGCGTENIDQARLCFVCRRPLTPLRENVGAGGDLARKVGSPVKERATLKRNAPQPIIDHRTIPDKIKLEYSHGIKDPSQKALEGLQTLLSHFQVSHMDIDRLLNEAAEFIWRQFGIDNVAIGLRDPKDGLYRYRAMVGFRGDALEAHKKIAYRKEQFFEEGEYHGVKISKYSRIYLAESNVPSEEELGSYNRPVLLTMKRKDATDSLEGDYIDTGIYGSDDELVGWIEISGTRTMKLPDVTTIRWVEVIASIIAAALICRGAR
jgi:hypothetical protein